MSSGVIQVKSNYDFENTYSRLKAALEANPNIFIVKEFDHGKNAEGIGLELGKAQAIFFGNPKTGTPLMQGNILAALDLPQKFLVYEQNGEVFVAYNDPLYLQQRHAIGSDAG